MNEFRIFLYEFKLDYNASEVHRNIRLGFEKELSKDERTDDFKNLDLEMRILKMII